MGTLPRPDIPPGPQRDLVDALHDQHHRAGWPSLRTLAREAGCSHTTVSNVFSSSRLPSWGVLELLVEAMDGDTSEFHRLWLTCGDQGTSRQPITPRIAGRRDEMTAVRHHLEGGTGLLVVSGEAGIGKTTLVATAHAASGAFVATGACRPLSTEVPLLPVADLLRSVLETEPTWFKAALAACPTYVPAALSLIVPELEAPETSPVSDEWARQRLYNAIEALLAALRDEQPLGVVVEDVHWADAATLDLIELLGSRAVPLVVTVRTEDPDVTESFAPWLARARRLPGVREVVLGPLTLRETAQQLALLGGGEPDPEEVARIHARSLGQPLFTEQLAQHPDDVPLPDLLADVLLRRLRGLGKDGWSVARALGVADRPLLPGQLAQISALDPVPGLRELDDRLLLAPADGPEARLRHPLVAAAIRKRLVPGEAADTHRRVAVVLTDVPDPPAAEIAEHWGAAGDHDQELHWRIKAARAATARFAIESAARQWQRVLALWPDDLDAAGSPAMSRAQMYVAALDAIHRQEFTAVVPLIDTALEVAADAAPMDAAGILRRVGNIRCWLGEYETALDLGAQAVAMYAGLPPCRDHVDALSKLSGALEAVGRYRESAEMTLRVVTEARRLGIASLLKASLADHAWHQALVGDSEGARASVDELAGIELDPPDPYCEIDVAVSVTDMLLMAGAPAAEVVEAARTALAIGERWDLHQWEDAILRYNVAEALVTQGHPDRAWELVAAQSEGEPTQERWSLYEQRAILELLRGRPEEARRHITAVGESPIAQGGLAFRVEFHVRAATIELWSGEPVAALDRAVDVLESGAATEEPAMLAPLLAVAARAAADSGDRERGDQLRDLHRRLTGDPFAPHPLIVTPAALGASWSAEMARLEGRETVEGWTVAATAWDRLTHPYDAAYCRWRGAQAAFRTGQATVADRLLKRAGHDARGHEPLSEVIRLCRYPAPRG